MDDVVAELARDLGADFAAVAAVVVAAGGE